MLVCFITSLTKQNDPVLMIPYRIILLNGMVVYLWRAVPPPAGWYASLMIWAWFFNHRYNIKDRNERDRFFNYTTRARMVYYQHPHQAVAVMRYSETHYTVEYLPLANIHAY